MSSKTKQCPKCFSHNPIENRFCATCGHQFSEIGQMKATFDLINYPYYTSYFKNIDSLIDNALNAYKYSNNQEAFENIENYLVNNPNNAIVWSFKSYLLYKLEYYTDALFCCDISLNIDDLFEFSWLTKAIILNSLNRKKDALLCFDEYLELNPEYDSLYELKEHMNSIFKTDIISIDFKPNDYYNFEDDYINNIDDLDDLLSKDNLDKINSSSLSISDYNDILIKIRETSDFVREKIMRENFIDFNSLSTEDKILLYAKSFAEVEFKPRVGGLGSYTLNKIKIEDRSYGSAIITTIIHELSHHILAEIFEQCIMKLLNTQKTIVIEKFVNCMLNLDDRLDLMDEYCAHSVQGRFSPYRYQDYGSWEKIKEEKFDSINDEQDIKRAQILGNTFYEDICGLMEYYIDRNLRDEIKSQFVSDKQDPYDIEGIFSESDIVIDDEGKINTINKIIRNNFEQYVYEPNKIMKKYRLLR